MGEEVDSPIIEELKEIAPEPAIESEIPEDTLKPEVAKDPLYLKLLLIFLSLNLREYQ